MTKQLQLKLQSATMPENCPTSPTLDSTSLLRLIWQWIETIWCGLDSVFELKGPPEQVLKKTPGSPSIKITQPVLKTWRFVEVEERPKWVATSSDCEYTLWYWNTGDDDFPVQDGLIVLLIMQTAKESCPSPVATFLLANLHSKY